MNLFKQIWKDMKAYPLNTTKTFDKLMAFQDFMFEAFFTDFNDSKNDKEVIGDGNGKPSYIN